MDFVVGFEVHRGHRTPVFPCSICESLAGKYPKEFKFKGWHPQCFCYCTPILATEDEMIEMQERILADEPVGSTSSVNMVDKMPKDFDDWIDANKERISNASSTPYWIKDNFVGGNVTKGLKLTDEIKVKKANILKQEAVSVANKAAEIKEAQSIYDDTLELLKDETIENKIKFLEEANNAESNLLVKALYAEKIKSLSPIRQAQIKRHATRDNAKILKDWEVRKLYNQYMSDGTIKKVGYIQKQLNQCH